MRYSQKAKMKLWIGILLFTAILIMIVLAPYITEYSVSQQDSSIRLLPPSKEHWLGTDRFGRDMFTRVLYGGRTTILASVLTLTLVFVMGTIIGILMGLHQNTLFDLVLMRCMDTLMAFPFMVFAMAISAFLGVGLIHLLIAIAVVWWVPFARTARSMVIQLKTKTSVEAALILGANKRTIIIRELLPRVMPTLMIQGTFELGNLIMSMSALSFLGLGAQPPDPEWGSMMSDGRAHFLQAPHVVYAPALFVIITVLSLNLIGESLRDYMDPYERIEI